LIIMARSTGYVHALGYRWLNRFYDPLVRITMRERRFKEQLVDQAALRPSMRVLDLGCGTGTLLQLLAGRVTAQVVGLDGDPDILAITDKKRPRAGARFALAAAFSTVVPFRDHSFDRVLSTLMFHHLDDEAKLRSLCEVRRVLSDDGELHVADWGRPHTTSMRIAASLVRALDGAAVTRANLEGRLPDRPVSNLRASRRRPCARPESTTVPSRLQG
jgi:ubiquinone/menaquinone biosynthesis C-methylase UbiE